MCSDSLHCRHRSSEDQRCLALYIPLDGEFYLVNHPAYRQYALGQLCGTIAIQVMIMTNPLRYRRVLYAQYLFIG
jgi:hypothetical protein